MVTADKGMWDLIRLKPSVSTPVDGHGIAATTGNRGDADQGAVGEEPKRSQGATRDKEGTRGEPQEELPKKNFLVVLTFLVISM